ncbi:hypothetical protein [Herbinix luporum]|jgi:hypothetical protein|uniref:hypothetical protein n=1 Tax=Herbinix luporum TaxID=1679721 RepID=UPI001768EF69|nr:hypothetical protein [Herbinix luporum]MDI9488101.1 hypothetical protein [Bacillota bacterium]HHT56336.1 hypothetical protein [Herbinix luporum]
MKKSAGKLFATGFLKSFLFFVFFFAVSLLSYRLVVHFLDIEDGGYEEFIPPVEKQQPITEARLDDVSKHLIYCVDEDDGSIKKIVLEILDCKKVKLFYITIPIKTKLTLSDSLHSKLVLIKPSIPQFLKLSAITGYIPKEIAYEYGVLIIEELLNIQISYYSVVPSSLYETVFTGKNNINNSSEDGYPKEVFSDGFIEFLHSIDTETQLRSYIKDIYNMIYSNLSYEDKLNYMETYLKIQGKDIHFDLIAGTDSNSAYTIDQSKASMQLKSYMGDYIGE